MNDPTLRPETAPAGDPHRLALRPREAALALGIGARLLWSLTNRGEVPHVRLGRAVIYPSMSFAAGWPNRRRRKGAAGNDHPHSRGPTSARDCNRTQGDPQRVGLASSLSSPRRSAPEPDGL